MIVIENKYSIGAIVYLRTDEDQRQWIVTRIMIAANNSLTYELYCGTTQGWHYDIEISNERNTILATTN